jgi:hypothetical protein
MESYTPVGGVIVSLVNKEFGRLLNEVVELLSPSFLEVLRKITNNRRIVDVWTGI